MTDFIKMKIEFTLEELNAMLAELGNIPAKYSMNLILMIQNKAQENKGKEDGK